MSVALDILKIAKLSSVPVGYFSKTEFSLNPDYYPRLPTPGESIFEPLLAYLGS